MLNVICTDPLERQFVADKSETEARPILKAMLQDGRREGYVRPEIPDEIIMLYFEMLSSGGAYCSDEMKQIVADKKSLKALSRLIYFGLFQKEFEVNFEKAGK